MKYQKLVAEKLYKALDGIVTFEKIIALIEIPKLSLHGELAFPCFELAKQLGQSPAIIASTLSEKVHGEFIEKTEALGPYLNIYLCRNLVSFEIVEQILIEKDNYGCQNFGIGKSAIVDFSSPNIAKPFSMGHLRSTVIGNSLRLILEKCGFNVVAINHLGDWGSQFGKLMVAYQKWGIKERIEQNPIQELFELYVKFHDVAKDNPDLEAEGRRWFKRLEDNDQEALALWEWFRFESLIEFSRLYELLNIKFDSFDGEAFYNDKMDAVIETLEQKALLTESDGCMIVDLANENMPPCLIKKSDGATLYATRDLAAVFYRQKNYQFDRALYVVGGEQSLHFNQLFTVLKKMDCEWANGMAHVPFGLMLKDGKKMSTRKGKIILLNEVIEEAIMKAKNNICEKSPNLNHADAVAKSVGIGSIIFQDLKNERLNNIEFSLDQMLKFEGETGPYVQYTHARACAILRKSDIKPVPSMLNDDESWEIIKLLEKLPQVITLAFNHYEPSIIAKYTIDLSQAFNKYCGKVRILRDDRQLPGRLALVKSTTLILKEGLRLLGIEAPEEM